MKHILCIVFILFLGFLLFRLQSTQMPHRLKWLRMRNIVLRHFLATMDVDTPLQVESEELLFDLRESAYYAKMKPAIYWSIQPTRKVEQRVIFPYVNTEEYYASYSGAAVDFVSYADFYRPMM